MMKMRNIGLKIDSLIRNRNRGVLLLEVVMAMMIMGIALVGIIEGYNVVLTDFNELEKNSRVRILIEERIETLESQGRFQPGVEEGAYENYWLYQWRIETEATEISNIYRVKILIDGPGVSHERVVYFREAPAPTS